MLRLRTLGVGVVLAVAIAVTGYLLSPVFGQRGSGKANLAVPDVAPRWIWLGKGHHEGKTLAFRKEIPGNLKLTRATLHATGDDDLQVSINGNVVASSSSWEEPVNVDVLAALSNSTKNGDSVLAVKVKNMAGPGGLLLRLECETTDKRVIVIHSDETWRVSDRAPAGWDKAGFDDSAWAKATTLGMLGDGPWVAVNAVSFGGKAKAKPRELAATPIKNIKAKKDFKVELLYSVPNGQGSWVCMTTDPKGRLITSDQYGKLFRVTPPRKDGETIQVEPLAVDIGEAQGLLWAFDSLYVVVNRGAKYKSGLYRVKASKGDDNLDTVELLREIQSGGGEHGAHAAVLSPDGKSIVVMGGNHTPMVKVDRSTVPMIWGEDFILPRQWDANGHAKGILSPGGWICRTDPDGKSWELISMGYRNQYDIAYNRTGELFTFDSDMEWDMNTPWYRPIRVCHAVDGSEFGWRSGTGVYPDHYPDNLPPVVNVGQGSPTGVAFGYGAKFPAKYQEALYLCDWSYGKLYAVHLRPDGSSYKGDLEEFITGTPLPLTDLVIDPKDGAMYFTTGGRRVTSGLYRVTYVGSESTEPAKGDNLGADDRAVRHKLESYFGKKGPEGIEAAWPYLGNKDRFLRWAARTILEHNPPAGWQERALKETEPQAAFQALLGLIRIGDKGLQAKILDRLDSFDLAKLADPLKLELARLYQLAFIRMGPPDDAAKTRTIARLNAHFPSKNREVNSEVFKLLVYLQSPTAAAKGLAQMTKAPTQEEQMDYALSLRTLKVGWTQKERETYFTWFLKAAAYRGGNSFGGFVRDIKAQAVAHLSPEEKASLKPILDASPKIENPWANAKPRPFVKKYTVDELLPIAEAGMTNRDFERGRQVFGEAKCFACHRFAQEGGAFGPDLTALAGRFNARDLLDSTILPSKTISDQYAAVNAVLNDGRVVSGRIINLNGDNVMINTDMLDPNKIVGVSRKNLESMELSKISMMPEGLLDNYTQDEVLDLLGYLLSRGDRSHAMFKK